MGKKSKQDDESEEFEEGTDSSHQSDEASADDLSEDEGTEAENDSLLYKLKKKIHSLQKGKSKAKADDEEEGESKEEDAEAAKKKKKSKLIQYVIIVALVIFVASDYIFPPEEPVAAIKPTKKGEKVKRPKVEAPPEEKPVTDTAATDPTTVTPPDSTINVTEAPAETAPTDTKISETPAEKPLETAPVETTAAELLPDATDTPDETEPTDTKISETPAEKPLEIAPLETTVTDVPAEDTATGESAIPGEDNLTDQILEDLEKQAKNTQQPEQKKEYVAPPDYEYRGRGLVYNCTGKHWACVDAPSYKTCEDNVSSVRYLQKKTECHPFNVYETPKGCEGVQNRMVSSSAKTAFCTE